VCALLNDDVPEEVPADVSDDDDGDDDDDDGDDDPSLHADLAELMVGSEDGGGAASPEASSTGPSRLSSARATAAARSAAAAREAAAARAAALGMSHEAMTALKLESFALNKAGDKAGAAAKFRAFKAMEKQLAAAADTGGAPAAAAAAPAAPVAHAPAATPPPPPPAAAASEDLGDPSAAATQAAAAAALGLLEDHEPTEGDGHNDDPELLGAWNDLKVRQRSFRFVRSLLATVFVVVKTGLLCPLCTCTHLHKCLPPLASQGSCWLLMQSRLLPLPRLPPPPPPL
jgi:hypothetical protein